MQQVNTHTVEGAYERLPATVLKTGREKQTCSEIIKEEEEEK